MKHDYEVCHMIGTVLDSIFNWFGFNATKKVNSAKDETWLSNKIKIVYKLVFNSCALLLFLIFLLRRKKLNYTNKILNSS